MHKRQPIKGIPKLDRAVPKNSRFDHITTTLNTGLNMNNVKTVTSREWARRRDEIFYRITRRQLVELFDAYEGEDAENIANDYDSGMDSPSKSPKIVTYAETQRPGNDKPYLILDTRDGGAYRECHILQALNFPLTQMKRDYMLPEIYPFRNKEEHLIIVYCDDERTSTEAAKFLVDRGTSNIFLLSGGMMELVQDYADMVEGHIPYPGFKDNKKIVHTPQKHRHSSRLCSIEEDNADEGKYNTPRTGPATGGLGLTSSALKRHNMNQRSTSMNPSLRSDAGMTNRTGQSVAESVISRAVSRKGKF